MMTTSDAARALAASRKTHGGGRPRVMRPCPTCRVKFSARELLRHKCPQK